MAAWEDEHWTPIFQGLLSRNCCQVHLPTKPTIHIPFYDLVFYFRKKKHKTPLNGFIVALNSFEDARVASHLTLIKLGSRVVAQNKPECCQNYP